MIMDDGFQSQFQGETDGLQTRVPVGELLTEAHFDAERERIFRRSWLYIGRESDVPEKGSHMVRDLPFLKTSLLIVRGEDGQVRCFHNLCTHRGNKLVRGGAGCSRYLTCGFHGWTFETDGTLGTITDEHQFRDLDRSKLNLPQVHTECWEGLVFINLEKEPSVNLAEWLGEMYGQYEGYFDRLVCATRMRVVVNCNWNLAVNSFIEGYHTKYIHHNSVPDYQGGRVNPQRHRPWMELFERHHRYSAPANPDHKYTAAEAIAWNWGKRCIPSFDGDMTGMPPGVNPGRVDNWAFDIVQFFPNIVMAVSNHRLMEMQFWPIDVNHTEFIGTVYLYPPKDLGERISQEFVRSRARQVVFEDLNTLEAQHQMLSSGQLTHLQLSQQEIAVQHHFKVAGDMLGNRGE
jgi:phenylpropionate dioxygenase-like ring-hydroxylating dioxygenase large terminal subunit